VEQVALVLTTSLLVNLLVFVTLLAATTSLLATVQVTATPLAAITTSLVLMPD
jgi:hypothetical protein